MAVFPQMDPGERASPFIGPRAQLGGGARPADTVIIVAAVVAGLYFGRDVLVPIALAVLLSFVLARVATAFGRLGIGRVPSVILAVFLAFLVLIGIGALIGKQVADLANDLPQYQLVIPRKLDALKNSALVKAVTQKAQSALHGLNFNLGRSAAPPQPAAPGPAPSPQDSILPVEVHEPALGPVQILRTILSALLPPLTTAAIVIIFVIFILLQQRDLRDRFIGLTGAHDLHRTTQALDEAAGSLSRYFSSLTAINAVFGIAVAIGLAVIGVPNPVLWGIFAGVLRFLPYIGAFIAAAFPTALAAAVDPGWSMVLETGLLFLVLETIAGQVLEPHLFAHSTGMSPLAVIVAAAFWTLIWGPPGLLLSTPITACLVVLGRHVEGLKFMEMLLGDRPPLSPEQGFYQRMLASDPDEAAFQAEALLKNMSLLDYYESVALPALALAQADVARGVMERSREADVSASVEHVVADLSDQLEKTADDEDQPEQSPLSSDKADAPASPTRWALCFGGRTLLDQAACAILANLLERRGVPARAAGPQALRANDLVGLNPDEVGANCVLFLDHQSIAAVQYSARRLRKKFPNAPIVVCLWGANDFPPLAESAKVDAMVTSLREAIDFCVASVQSSSPVPESDAPARLERSSAATS